MFRATAIVAFVLAVTVTAAAQPQPPGQAGRYFVEFDALGPAATNAIRGAGGTTVHEFPQYNVIAARLPQAAVQALRNNPRVRSVTDDVLRYPFSQTVPYGISMVCSRPAWASARSRCASSTPASTRAMRICRRPS